MSTAVLDRGDALAHLGHQPLVRPAHGGDDAELGRAGLGGLPGGLDQRRDVQPGRAHRRVEQAGLRAEVAVLRAAAGLDARRCPRPRPRGRTSASAPRARAPSSSSSRSSGSSQHARTCASSRPARRRSTWVAGGGRGCPSDMSRSPSRRAVHLPGSLPHRSVPPNAGRQAGARDAQEVRSCGHAGLGRTPASGRAAMRPRSATLQRDRPGRARAGQAADDDAGQRRCPVRPCASRVSAVWFSVPRPAATTSSDRGRESAGQVGDRPAVRVVPHQQPAGALDDRPGRARLGRSPDPPSRRRRQVERGRARCAGPRPRATAGRGSGRTRADRPQWTAGVPRPGRPARRAPRRSGRASPPPPDRRRASAATAAVTTVFPTPVPVPVTTRMLIAGSLRSVLRRPAGECPA